MEILNNIFRIILYILVGIMLFGIAIVMLPWFLIVSSLENDKN